jgi:hypothetical protein
MCLIKWDKDIKSCNYSKTSNNFDERNLFPPGFAWKVLGQSQLAKVKEKRAGRKMKMDDYCLWFAKIKFQVAFSTILAYKIWNNRHCQRN